MVPNSSQNSFKELAQVTLGEQAFFDILKQDEFSAVTAEGLSVPPLLTSSDFCWITSACLPTA